MSNRNPKPPRGDRKSPGKPDNDGDAGGADLSAIAPAGPGPSITIPGAVDPGSVGPSDEPISEPVGRRRGRPVGSTGSAKAKTLPLNVTGLEKLLVGIHGGLAVLSGRPEWSLDTEQGIFDGKTEAQFFAQSIKDVSDHYGNGLLDKKTLDWLNLGQCLAIVYIGRIYAIRSTPKARVAPKVAPPPVHQPERPATMHRTEPPINQMNGGSPAPPSENAARRGIVAGIGEVEFPPDHPLMGGQRRDN